MGIEGALRFAEEDLKKIEEELVRSLASEVAFISTVGKYVFGSGGKRLRPLLTILSSRLCRYKGGLHIPLAAAIELIHTATLLHDDVVDNSDLRRGRRSVNYRWNSDTSILVGDFLFTRSFCTMVEGGDMRILDLMSRTCRQIAEGEILELVKSGNVSTTEEDYVSIITYKTAVLIAAACQVGAILGGVSDEKEMALYHFGMSFGTAFQIVDDALDLMADQEELGKPLCKDLEEGKITLPIIRSLQNSRSKERKRLVELIQKRSFPEEERQEIVEMIRHHGALKYTMDRAKRYIAEAKHYLDLFPPSEEKEHLLSVADFVVQRRT